MSRSRILNRLRQSGGKGPPLPDGRPLFPRYRDRVEQFRRRLEAAAGVFLDARGGMKTALESLLGRTGAGEVYWDSDLFARHGIEARLRDPEAFERGRLVYSRHRRHQVDLPLILSSRGYDRSLLAEAVLSISVARWGIAETGTIVHTVAAAGGRLLPFLPQSHAFLLREQDLLHNHGEFFDTFDAGRSSAAVLVTGPSRTADIEKTLVTGVHGPRQMFVLLTG